MTDTWGPALDAEIAIRREELVRAARRRPRPTPEERVQLRVLLAVRRAASAGRTNSRTAVAAR